jgi:hypothetical protein
MIVATMTSAVSTLPKGLSFLRWLDDFLYLPEVLYVLSFVWLICSGPESSVSITGSRASCLGDRYFREASARLSVRGDGDDQEEQMRKVYRHDEIAKLAYELWERRGHPLGSPEIDWYAAESALGVKDSREEFSLPGVSFEPEEGAYREP